jgi:hypothetical protein
MAVSILVSWGTVFMLEKAVAGRARISVRVHDQDGPLPYVGKGSGRGGRIL